MNLLDYEATLALQIDRLVRRFHSDLHPRAQRIDEEKVGPIGGMVLFVIAETSPTTAQKIGETLGRDKSQVSRLISLLSRKGLVEKTVDITDTRISKLCLTDKGKLQVAAFNGALVATTRDILNPLNDDEVETFSRLVSKILDGKT